jgi:uncharacterized protein YndB with AHSA1/START domain
MKVEHIGNHKDKLTIVHEFRAPKKLVFNAFAKEEALAEWWGPVECKNTVLKLDFEEGGVFHYKMEKEGKTNYGRFTFVRIQPFDLLEFVNSFSDENGNILRAPFSIQLPLKIFYRMLFAENKGKTTITLTGEPMEASKEEILNFKSINRSMQQGFGATFEQLVAYLNKIQTN